MIFIASLTPKLKNLYMGTKKNPGVSQDRKLVAGGEKWEVSYMRNKFKVSAQQVSGAVRAVGNSRTKVEEYLSKKK